MAKPVLLIRPSGNEADAKALSNLGLGSTVSPFLIVSALKGSDGIANASYLLAGVSTTDWVIATSANGLSRWGQLVGNDVLAEAFAVGRSNGVRFAAIGKATAGEYSKFGIDDVFMPNAAYGEELGRELAASFMPSRAVMPVGTQALGGTSEILEAAGWSLSTAAVYETTVVDDEPVAVQAALSGGFSLAVLRSPSAARAIHRWVGNTLPVVCAGKTTAIVAAGLGLRVLGVADAPTPATVAQCVLSALNETEEN